MSSDETPRSAPQPFDVIGSRSGIDYALRTVQQSQVQFSLMADNKANIMITVCSLVLSASITQLHRSTVLVPLLVLDVFTAIALVCALFCVLPSRRGPPMRKGEVDVEHPGFNPLFFLHFHALSPDAYERELEKRFESSGELYRSLARDIHAGGRVLAESKYRWLRWSYFAFIAGLLAGVATAVGLAVRGA